MSFAELRKAMHQECSVQNFLTLWMLCLQQFVGPCGRRKMQSDATLSVLKGGKSKSTPFLHAVLKSVQAIARQSVCPGVFLTCYVRHQKLHMVQRHPRGRHFEKCSQLLRCTPQLVQPRLCRDVIGSCRKREGPLLGRADAVRHHCESKLC